MCLLSFKSFGLAICACPMATSSISSSVYRHLLSNLGSLGCNLSDLSSAEWTTINLDLSSPTTIIFGKFCILNSASARA